MPKKVGILAARQQGEEDHQHIWRWLRDLASRSPGPEAILQRLSLFTWSTLRNQADTA